MGCEGSEAEGASRPRMDPAIAERHDLDIQLMERQRQARAETVGRARAAAAQRDDERRRRARRSGERARGRQRRQALGRMRRARGMPESGQYGIGAELALRGEGSAARGRGAAANNKAARTAADQLAAAPHGLGTPDAHGGETRK